MDNMLSMLAHDGVEALVRNDQGRIFVQAADLDRLLPAPCRRSSAWHP